MNNESEKRKYISPTMKVVGQCAFSGQTPNTSILICHWTYLFYCGGNLLCDKSPLIGAIETAYFETKGHEALL